MMCDTLFGLEQAWTTEQPGSKMLQVWCLSMFFIFFVEVLRCHNVQLSSATVFFLCCGTGRSSLVPA